MGSRTKIGWRPATRATRRTASPSDRSSGPSTAIVRPASLASPKGRCLQEPRDIVHGDRTDGTLAEAHETGYREGVEGVAEVVEHVIASTVADASLEDRVGEAGSANQLFGGPLRAVVGRGAVRASAQETQNHDALHAGRACGFDDGLRGFDVDGFIGLVTELPVDPGAMDDRLASGHRLGEAVDAGVESMPGPTRQDHRLVTVHGEPVREMPPDEPGATGDDDPHVRSSRSRVHASIAGSANPTAFRPPWIRAMTSMPSQAAPVKVPVA